MDLSTFMWSVLGSLVATGIAGGVIIKKKKKNIIKQKGDNNRAMMDSDININDYYGNKGDKDG